MTLAGKIAERVIEACPDAEWRLIFALCRYGGLRCPSEIGELRWIDIDWERNRFTVHSPKTAHHEGKETRVVPIFPELYPYLRDAFELAKPGAEFVVERTRDPDVNLRTQLGRILRRAGVELWPQLFHQLRRTRQNELEEEYPSHVVCVWIGNSEPVAREHYLHPTEEHYRRAATAKRSKKRSSKERNRAELSGTAYSMAFQKPAEFPLHSAQYRSVHNCQSPPRGVEPNADSTGKKAGRTSDRAKSGALADEKTLETLAAAMLKLQPEQLGKLVATVVARLSLDCRP